MSSIIRPDKVRRYPDPYILTVRGTHGPCALCGHYSKLTENHVPPEAVGNYDSWLAQSYMTATASDQELFFGRRFSGGVRFRTLCEPCNNSLGGSEDKALVAFYNQVRSLVSSPIRLPPVMQVAAKPNLILRGLLAHIASANDDGIPTQFDNEARDIFFKKRSLRLSSWNMFYWLYLREEMFLMRDAFLTKWSPTVELDHVQILKAPPLAFMFSQQPRFHGLPNMMQFIQARDEEEIDVPIMLARRDRHPMWPIVPMNNQIILLAGSSYGLIARPH